MTELTDVPGVTSIIAERLKNANITTAELLAAADPSDVCTKARLTVEKAEEIVHCAGNLPGHFRFESGLEVEARMKAEPRLSTGIESIDSHLEGGIRPGTVLEFTGHQWAGKTLFCAQLAVMAQFMYEHEHSRPVVVWYDADDTFRPDTVKEIAFRVRLDPEKVMESIRLVKAARTGKMEESFETVMQLHKTERTALVVVDSLPAARNLLEKRSAMDTWEKNKKRPPMSEFIGLIQRLADTTDAVVAVTSRVMVDVSRITGVRSVPRRAGTVAHSINYKFDLEATGERERSVVVNPGHGFSRKWKLYIGYGGLYGDRSSRNGETRRVRRYVRKLKGID